MPIVTAHCRVVDGAGNREEIPQVFLKVRGKFYRTPIHLQSVYKCKGGWCESTIHYRANIKLEDKIALSKLAQEMLNNPDLEKYALDGTGLKHCGIRFVF